jgi:plastocyanin
MKRSLFLAGVVALASFAFIVSACGDDDDDDSGDSTPAVSQPTTAATRAPTSAATESGGGDETPAGGGGAGTLAVTAQDFSFSLDADSIPTGSVLVTLTNEGAAPHTITFYTDEEYTDQVGGTERVAAGGSGSASLVVPDDADELYYRCEVHPTQMEGEIEVEQ